MGEPVRVRYEYTADEICQGMEIARRVQSTWITRLGARFFIVIGVMMGIEMPVLYATSAPERRPPLAALLTGVGFGALAIHQAFFTRRTRRWQVGWSLRKNPFANLEVEYEADERGLRFRCAVADSSVDWSLLQKVVECPEGYLVYTDANLFNWLPLHGFAQPWGPDEFERLAREQGPAYQRVRGGRQGTPPGSPAL